MAVNYNASTAKDGLVLYLDAGNPKSYPGSGTSWYDLSGNGNTGTLVNGPTYNAGNIVFDGANDYVSMGSSPISNSLNPITISLWVYPKEIGRWQRMYNVAPNMAVQLAGLSQSMDNKFRWFLYDGTVRWDVQANTSAIINTWYSVVCVNDGRTAKLYINNILQTMTSTITSAAISGAVTIATGGSEYFNGNISNVQVYNRALSTNEITQNFNALRGRYGI